MDNVVCSHGDTHMKSICELNHVQTIDKHVRFSNHESQMVQIGSYADYVFITFPNLMKILISWYILSVNPDWFTIAYVLYSGNLQNGTFVLIFYDDLHLTIILYELS